MEQNLKKTMVEKAKMFAAIDIGTTKIVALVGYKNDAGEIVVCGRSNIASTGVWGGQVSNVSHASHSIRTAVENASAEAGFFPKQVVVGVAGRHVRSTSYTVQYNRVDYAKVITPEELEDLRKAANNVAYNYDEEIINVVPQNYVLDGAFVENPLGMSCKHIDAQYQVIIGKIQALAQLRQSVDMAGLEVAENGLYLEPLASSDAVLTEQERKLGVAMIDIGGGTTDVAIYKDNILRATSSIPFGGNLITSDIAQGYGILDTDAEEIKKQYGEAISDFAPNAIISIEGVVGQASKQIEVTGLAKIIQSRVEEIIDSINFEIALAIPSNTELLAGVVVTGGGSKLKNMAPLLSYKVGMTSRLASPIRSVLYNDNTLFNDSAYSTAVGLLLRAASLHEKASKHVEIIETVQEIEVPELEPETAKEEMAFEAAAEAPREKHGFLEKMIGGLKKQVGGFFEVDDIEYK